VTLHANHTFFLALRITSVEPKNDAGFTLIQMDDSSGRYISPSESEIYHPKVGDYFVSYEAVGGTTYIIPKRVFDVTYHPVGSKYGLSTDVETGSGLISAKETWSDIAKAAYYAFYSALDQDGPVPFRDLPRNVQSAWEASVRHSSAILNGATDAHSEGAARSWQGWERP